jgi:putative ABC transport system substrate-binding protein
MRRRELIKLIAGAAVAYPLAATAQQKTPVVGLLVSTSADAYASRIAFVRQGLSETGYVEGRNVAIEYRWAENQYDRLPQLAADLVRRQVDVIVARLPRLPQSQPPQPYPLFSRRGAIRSL